MKKDLNRKPMLSCLIWGIVMLLVAAWISFNSISTIITMDNPVKLSGLTLEEVKELKGQYVEAEINFIVEPFCYSGSSEENPSEIQYIVATQPVSTLYDIILSDYIGVSISSYTLMKEMKALYDRGNTAIANMNIDDLGESIVLKGMIDSMDPEEAGFFNTVLSEIEWTEASHAPFILRAGKEPGMGSLSVFALMLAVTLIIVALLRFIKLLLGGYQRDIKSFCKETISPDATMDALEYFYKNTTPLPFPGDIRINNRWIMFQEKLDTRILNIENVCWVYPYSNTRKMNGILYYRKRGLVLCTKYDQYHISMSEDDIASVIEMLFPMLPYAVFGYNDTLDSLYPRKIQELTALAIVQHQQSEQSEEKEER